MAQINTVAGMVTELVGRFRNLEPGHAAVTVYAIWRDICEETHAWRYRLVQDTADSQRWYTLVVPPTISADIQMIYQVFVNGTQLSTTQCDFSEPPTLKVNGLAAAVDTGAAPTQDTPNGAGLNVIVSLLPWLNDPLGVPAWEFGKYHAAVYEGCCSRLCLEFQQTYADGGTAKVMADGALQRYNAEKVKIRYTIEQENAARGMITFSPVPFSTNEGFGGYW